MKEKLPPKTGLDFEAMMDEIDREEELKKETGNFDRQIEHLQKTAREDFCAALPLELRPMSWSVWLRWWPPRLTSLFWTLPMAILPMY